MALPNITPPTTTIRPLELPNQSRSSVGFSDLLRTMATLQTMQYRAARNAARLSGGGTGLPGNVEGDYMMMPDGSLKFVPGKTVEMRKHNLATMQSIELDNMLKGDELLQEKLRQLETNANTMSYDKQNEILEGARSDVRRIAEANKVDPQALLNRAIKPYSDKLSQLSRDIARDDGLSAILDSAKISGKRLWNTIKQVGALGDAEAKLRLGEDTSAYAQKVTAENAYLRDQQLRAQEGQNVFERMSGPTGSALANIASGALDVGIQFAPAIAAATLTGGTSLPATIGAWGTAGGWGALTGLQEQAERISGTQLSAADKAQAMDNAAEQAALVGAVSNLPFSFGPAAKTARHLWGPAVKETLESRGRTLGNYLKKDLPLTAAENVTADVGATIGQNLVFDAATGQATPTLEGVGEAVVGSLGASVPFALFPWMQRPRTTSTTPTIPGNADTTTTEPTAPTAPSGRGNSAIKAPKQAAAVNFQTAIFNEDVPRIREDAQVKELWNDLKSPSKDTYDGVHDALVKFVLNYKPTYGEGQQGVSAWDILRNIQEGGALKKSQRPDTSILTPKDTFTKTGKDYLNRFLTETNTEEGWANATSRYAERGGVIPQSAPVAEPRNEGPAGTADANLAGNSGVASPEPAPLEGAADLPAQEPADGNRAVEVGGAGGSALQGERTTQTTEVHPSAEGGTPDAGADAGRHAEGAGAAGGEPGPSAGGEAGKGIGSNGNAEPSADAGAVFESFGPSLESLEQAQALVQSGIPLGRTLDPADFERPANDPVQDFPFRESAVQTRERVMDTNPQLVASPSISMSSLRDPEDVTAVMAELKHRLEAETKALKNLAEGKPSGIAPTLEAEGVEAGNRARITFHQDVESGATPDILANLAIRDVNTAHLEYKKALDAYNKPKGKKRVKAKSADTPALPVAVTEVSTPLDIMTQVGAAVEALGNQPKDVKYYESLVKNQDKVQNALRSLVHAKLLDANTPGVKKAPHMTKARNELAKYGAVPEMIPDIPDFAEDLLLARMTGNDIDTVDLYLAKLDEMNAQDRTLNADGCKTI